MKPVSDSPPDRNRSVKRPLTGWGRFPRSSAQVFRPERLGSLRRVLTDRNEPTVLARGMGRSYGDAALNAGGAVVLSERLDRLLSFDESTGVLVCEAGTTFHQILKTFVPRGWFPPVTPGTRYATIGGAIASDVHGKNHHRAGALSSHLPWLELWLPDGREMRCSMSENRDLYFATLGGLGLTGFVLRAALRLDRIETSFMKVRFERTECLAETMSKLEEHDQTFDYTVAWLDALSSGKRSGRGVLMSGHHAVPDDLGSNERQQPFAMGRNAPRLRLPIDTPGFILNRYSVGLFNEFYFRTFPRRPQNRIVHFDRYFYPLDSIGEWYRLYGKQGLLQYQCLLPFEESGEKVGQILSLLHSSRTGSFLAVLKRMGDEAGPLSFPKPGFTLALDLPRSSRVLKALNDIDSIVLDGGGRVYLAKDARLSPESFRRMYPRFREWFNVKKETDPEWVFSSDLARRLDLPGGPR